VGNESRRLLDQRPDLINRYVRRWTYRKSIALAQVLARKIARPRMLLNERKRRNALVSALKTLARETAKARRLGFNTNFIVLNVGLFLLIAERDIQAVKVDALTHPDAWHRALCARIMLLTIHELQLDKVAGNQLRQALEDAQVPELLRKEVAEALRIVRRSQERARKQFAYLRNSTIAHRDADALRQHADITDIDSVAVTNIAAEFYEGSRTFFDMLPKLLAHLGTTHALVSQFVKQLEKKRGDEVDYPT
jgi:hypothetical protein